MFWSSWGGQGAENYEKIDFRILGSISRSMVMVFDSAQIHTPWGVNFDEIHTPGVEIHTPGV